MDNFLKKSTQPFGQFQSNLAKTPMWKTFKFVFNEKVPHLAPSRGNKLALLCSRPVGLD